MENNEKTNNHFSKIIELINKNKPEFGTLNLELVFHQNFLCKIKILSKLNIIVFEKEAKNG
jgi:malic enzyme